MFEISVFVSLILLLIFSNLVIVCNGYLFVMEILFVFLMGINIILVRCSMVVNIRKIIWICCKRMIYFLNKEMKYVFWV